MDEWTDRRASQNSDLDAQKQISDEWPSRHISLNKCQVYTYISSLKVIF